MNAKTLYYTSASIFLIAIATGIAPYLVPVPAASLSTWLPVTIMLVAIIIGAACSWRLNQGRNPLFKGILFTLVSVLLLPPLGYLGMMAVMFKEIRTSSEA